MIVIVSMRVGVVVSLLRFGLDDVLAVAQHLVNGVNCLSAVVGVLSLQSDVFNSCLFDSAVVFGEIKNKAGYVCEGAYRCDKFYGSIGIHFQSKLLSWVKRADEEAIGHIR